MNRPPVCNDLDDETYITHETNKKIFFGSAIEDDDDLIFTYAFIEEPGFLVIDGQYIEVYTKDNMYATAEGGTQLVSTVIIEVKDSNNVGDANG